MKLFTLKKANELQNRIKEYELALECFEERYGENNEHIYDRTPQIILNVDDLDGGRENIPLPMVLSNGMVEFLKVEIESALEIARTEFENL